MSEKLDRLMASAKEVIRQNAGLRVDGKTASNRTRELTEHVLTECCRRLHRLGFYLENVEGLQRKHIDALVGSWYAQPMAPKTIQNLFSRVKIFCGWLGKSGIVSQRGAIGHLPGVEASELKVKTYTEKSVSWTGCGVTHVKGNHRSAFVVCDAQSWADVIAASASERKGLQGLAIGDDCIGVTLGNQR